MKNLQISDKDSFNVYEELLTAVAALSGMFSESTTPYINYRVAENIFCKSFNAENLSRSDTAFDAKIGKEGIGIKTFILKGDSKIEKIAEFNKLSNELAKLQDSELAFKLCELRNCRINLAKNLYNIDTTKYHIIGRKTNGLYLFDTDYNLINTESISITQSNKSGIKFYDKYNEYTFNRSKSTLYRKFIIPSDGIFIPTEIIKDPFEIILKFKNYETEVLKKSKLEKGVNYVILPLYGSGRIVHERSGLNQWNASGRERDLGEIYIPIPKIVHKLFPNILPEKYQEFNLKVPDGSTLNAKICQSDSKALMTNPNKALSDWLLRKVLRLKEGELATIELLDELGVDSVILQKIDNDNFTIDIMKTGSYEKFIS